MARSFLQQDENGIVTGVVTVLRGDIPQGVNQVEISPDDPDLEKYVQDKAIVAGVMVDVQHEADPAAPGKTRLKKKAGGVLDTKPSAVVLKKMEGVADAGVVEEGQG